MPTDIESALARKRTQARAKAAGTAVLLAFLALWIMQIVLIPLSPAYAMALDDFGYTLSP